MIDLIENEATFRELGRQTIALAREKRLFIIENEATLT